MRKFMHFLRPPCEAIRVPLFSSIDLTDCSTHQDRVVGYVSAQCPGSLVAMLGRSISDHA